MSTTDERRDRLEELLSLAQAYQGCSRKQLAQSLGRDASNLVPNSGIPKLDLVVKLAKILDWPVDEVVETLWSSNGHERQGTGGAQFEELEKASLAAHRDGRYHQAIDLARSANEAAASPEQHALASNREALGWDGLGRYTSAMEACQRGLAQPSLSTDRRVMLQANLANAYYALWHLVEANAMAQDLLLRYQSDAPTNRLNEVVHAFAYYVRGHSERRMLASECQDAQKHARIAKEDLTQARRMYLALDEKYQDGAYGGIANTCLGGLLELQVFLKEREPTEVLDQFADPLDQLVDPNDFPAGDWLESYAWWCIFGCNVALRHLDDPRELQHRMAIFTNKADEIAECMRNWAIRERVFTMEYARRQRFVDWTGVEADWAIDSDDVRVITGTMGRFPAFRGTAWRILRTAKVVKGG
jgi:hypothetical protein